MGGDRFYEYGGDAFVEAESDVEGFLQRQAARNPASTSMCFDRLMRTILSTLVGTPTTDEVLRSVPLHDRTPALFGLGLASYTVVEETGNGAHHMHTLAWCGAMPALCSSAASDAELFRALSEVLDRQYRCDLPLEIHIVDAARRAVGAHMYRSQYHKLPPMVADEDRSDDPLAPLQVPPQGLPGLSSEFRHTAHMVAVGKQMHVPLHEMENHQKTCKKPPNGTHGCRMSVPFGHPVKATRAVSVTAHNTDQEVADHKERVKQAKERGDTKMPVMRLHIEHQLPYSEITCGECPEDDSLMPDTVKPCSYCWPREKSLLNSGDLWLSVTQPAEEEAQRRTDACANEVKACLYGLIAHLEKSEKREAGEECDDCDEVMEESTEDPVGVDGSDGKQGALQKLVPRGERSSITIELKRPKINWPTKPVPDGLKGAALQSAYSEMYHSMPQEVRDELERPEWAEVKQKLEELTTVELGLRVEATLDRVLRAWSRVPCANSVLTCYNEVLTGVLGCNTAPYLLGSRESSRAACFYLVKCVTLAPCTLHF